jgi:cytochrome d ubiquinol oxidase subunit I
VDSYVEAIFNKNMPWGVSHMWFACLATSLFVIGGLSAWYILKGRNTDFFLKSFKVALIGVIFVVPIQIYLGDSNGREVFANQPAKGAAIEAHWTTNQEDAGAAWNLLAWPNPAEQKNDWAISIPGVLSVLATRDKHGQVQGLKSFPKADQPPAIALIFYSFRIMVGVGIFFLGLLLWTLVIWLRGQLKSVSIGNNRLLLSVWVASIPLGYVATECGWIVREVGRQPWIIYGLLRTRDAASTLPVSVVAVSLVSFLVIYGILFVLFLVFAARIIRKGPDLTLMPPS